MMRSLYTAAIVIYGWGIQVSAFWNAKARLWVSGRNKQAKITAPTLPQNPIWMHCASLGEFEQGRPIIEHLKKLLPDQTILLSFFSPSGFEIRKSYPLADAVVYLPLDTPDKMKAFTSKFNPKLAIFVKYEIWHNCFDVLHRRGIPLFMVSAKFRPSQVYFKPWGRWFAKSLNKPQHIFTQDAKSVKLLNEIGIEHASVAGDTRFDRVLEILEADESLPDMEAFKAEGKLIVAGSTWPRDEAMLAEWWKQSGKSMTGWRLVLVPHEISKSNVAQLGNLLPEARAWSTSNFGDSRVLIIDTMGMLNKLYRYAEIAYIGGGFGAGIHNTLEAAVYGCPIIFGPAHQKFDEALGLIKAGAAKSVDNQQSLQKAIEHWAESKVNRTTASRAAATFVKNGAGATNFIVKALVNRAKLN
jgi:3-deoxy-D-manno-octulosonic-acid transferase